MNLGDILQWRFFAANGGFSRFLAAFIASKCGETRPSCAELLFSAAGADACNLLILRELSRLFVHFSRTYGSDAEQNPVTYSIQITYAMNQWMSLQRSCEPPTNLARQASSDLGPGRPLAESTLDATSSFTLALRDGTRRFRLESFDFRASQQSLPSNR